MKIHFIKKLLLIVALGSFCVPTHAMWQGVFDSTKEFVQNHPYVSGALSVAGLSYGVYKVLNGLDQSLSFGDLSAPSQGEPAHIFSIEEKFKQAVYKKNFGEAHKILQINGVCEAKYIDCFQAMLFELAGKHKHTFLKILLDSGLADVNKCSFQSGLLSYRYYPWTPLTSAIGMWSDEGREQFINDFDRFETVKLLLDYGAHIDAYAVGYNNTINEHRGGRVALHLAVETNKLDLVKLLLEYGADYKVLDGFKKTALDYIDHDTNREIVDLLVMVSGVQHERMSYKLWCAFFHNCESYFSYKKNGQVQKPIIESVAIPFLYPQLFSNFGSLNIENFEKAFNGKRVDLMMRLRNIKALELVMPFVIASGNAKVFEERAQGLHNKTLKFEIEKIILKAKKSHESQMQCLHGPRLKKLFDVSVSFRPPTYEEEIKHCFLSDKSWGKACQLLEEKYPDLEIPDKIRNKSSWKAKNRLFQLALSSGSVDLVRDICNAGILSDLKTFNYGHLVKALHTNNIEMFATVLDYTFNTLIKKISNRADLYKSATLCLNNKTLCNERIVQMLLAHGLYGDVKYMKEIHEKCENMELKKMMESCIVSEEIKENLQETYKMALLAGLRKQKMVDAYWRFK